VRDVKKLYELYKNDIYKFLFYQSRNKEIAEDLLQETFLQAFTSIHRFKGKAKIRTWLFQIAKYVYFNHAKKAKKFEYANIETLNLRSEEMNLEEQFIEKERGKKIFKALHNLSEPHREIIILKIYSQLSFREIGEVFEKSENWARVTFHRGKLKLLGNLSEGGNVDEFKL
jgi:RNA polymerase sigma factor (sigma-70 family)